MKKLVLLLLLVLVTTGCSNTVTINFKDNINMNVKLSFTQEEYRYYLKRNSGETLSKEEAASAIEALTSDELDAFIEGNNEVMKEKRHSLVDENYNLEYEYDYSYSNFNNNTLLNKCFEYFNYEEDDKNVYINMGGKSICAPFNLSVKADDKMIANNGKKVGNEYIWSISENNNSIYMTLSKTTINTTNVLYIVLFIIGLLLTGLLFYLNSTKNKRNSYY